MKKKKLNKSKLLTKLKLNKKQKVTLRVVVLILAAVIPLLVVLGFLRRSLRVSMPEIFQARPAEALSEGRKTSRHRVKVFVSHKPVARNMAAIKTAGVATQE